MKFYLGVTDNHWFDFLSSQNREDINFWQPSGNTRFSALSEGGPFLFKLKSPENAIGGVGFFSSHTFLPLSMAWDIFGKGNGCNSLVEFQRMIIPLRRDRTDSNPQIGCIVLTNPVFFKKEDWIDPPGDWGRSIVQGKTYSTDTVAGMEFWLKIELILQKYLPTEEDPEKNQINIEGIQSPMYGLSISKVRLGQGAFRVLVTDAYHRKCAISGERTLPVLDSAHIQPFAESGPHLVSNALLLHSDLHRLFDSGYLTITKELKVEVSNRIKQEFENGKDYYKFHGKGLCNLPSLSKYQPEEKFIHWHNEKIYQG